MAARAREWRLDGTIVGLDSKRGVLRLQPDILVMRSEGDAVEMGAARETSTRLIATDAATQMWTPDGQLRPLDFAALRNAAQIIAIGPLQNQGDKTILRARLLMLSDGLPADYRPQVLAAPTAKVQTPPQISLPTRRPQVLAPSIFAQKTPPQVLAAPPNAPHLSTPATRPPSIAPPQISAPQKRPQVLAAPIAASKTSEQVLAAPSDAPRISTPATRPPEIAPPQISAPTTQEQILAAPQFSAQVLAEPRAPIVMRQAPIPLPLAPPILNRASQNEDARHTINATSPGETSRTQTSVETRSRAALNGEDWSRRVPPPTLSIAPNISNDASAPQVLASPISAARDAVIENRAVQPPNIERAAPLKPPHLSVNTNTGDLTAPIVKFPRAAVDEKDENAPAATASELRATTPLSAPRDARRPALSLDVTALTGRGALPSAIVPQEVAPNAGDGRAVLRLDDAQSLLLQQQTATLARDKYAQLRTLQTSIPWTTFSNGADDEKIVALTFDDGPHPNGTPAVLAQLHRFQVPATFFVVGRNVEKYPDLLREEAAAGHDIANHSWHHFQGVKLSKAQWHEEIAGNNRIIENVLGVAPRWFRAPGCHYSLEALQSVRDLKMVRADTSNNSGDWEQPDPQKIVNRVLGRLAPGQVLLFHDSAPQTAQALPILLRELQARGYRCVTLTELAQRAAQVPGFVPEFHPAGQGIVLPANVATR